SSLSSCTSPLSPSSLILISSSPTPPTSPSPLSLHAALPICRGLCHARRYRPAPAPRVHRRDQRIRARRRVARHRQPLRPGSERTDRKSTRLNSSHVKISYAVFCLKKKKNQKKRKTLASDSHR